VTALARLTERVLYFAKFGGNVRAAANSRENFHCLLRLAMLREPSRAFGKVQHAQSQHHAGDGCETKHPSLPAASGKRVVNDVCGKDSDRDRELE
jgi:hypothetical protein